MQPTTAKVDPREGTLTVKMEDKEGKEVEKTFQLTEDVEYAKDQAEKELDEFSTTLKL